MPPLQNLPSEGYHLHNNFWQYPCLLVLVGGGDRVAVPQRITNDTVQLVSSTVRWWLVENSPFLVYEGPLGRSQERPSLLPMSTVAPVAGRNWNVPRRNQQGQHTHSASNFQSWTVYSPLIVPMISVRVPPGAGEHPRVSRFKTDNFPAGISSATGLRFGIQDYL